MTTATRPRRGNPTTGHRHTAHTTAVQHPSPPDQLLTVPEVMARLRLGRSAVYDLLRTRKLGSVHIGRCRRIPDTALTAYLNHLMEEAP